MATLGLAAAAALAACNRSEGRPLGDPSSTPRAEPPPAAPAPTEQAPAASAPTSPPPCLVPLASEPPPPASPAPSCPADPGPVPDLARGTVRFPEAPGAPEVQVEIAKTATEHARGLMYRTELPEGTGMLFSWTDERVRSFWMRNTCIPLDMLFLALDGTVLGVQEQVPVLNDRSRSIPCPAGHVLEVNAGWVREHGVAPGMRAELE